MNILRQLFGNSDLPTISVEILHQEQDRWQILDVRTKDEWNQDGHIATAAHQPLGPQIQEYLKSLDKRSRVAFVCHSGGRSAAVTKYAIKEGFESAVNVQGGMRAWKMAGFPVE